MRILGTSNQVPFPMTGNCPILHVSGTVADEDAINDLPARLARRACVFHTSHAASGAERPDSFFPEHPSGLNEQAAVDRFMGDPHGALIWKCQLEPSRNLFR